MILFLSCSFRPEKCEQWIKLFVGFPDLFLWFLLQEVRIQLIPSASVLKFKVVGRLLFPFPPPLPPPPPPPPLEDD